MISAAIPLGIGTVAIVRRHAYFLGVRPLQIAEYSGNDAIAIGVAFTAIGLLIHGHCFWTASRKYYFVSEILKPLSLLLLIAAIGFVVANQIEIK